MKVLLIILGVLIIIFIVLPIIFLLTVMLRSAKYEAIWEKTENGWELRPVYPPCGEPIDEEFIKLWHDREREYKEWRKKNK